MCQTKVQIHCFSQEMYACMQELILNDCHCFSQEMYVCLQESIVNYCHCFSQEMYACMQEFKAPGSGRTNGNCWNPTVCVCRGDRLTSQVQPLKGMSMSKMGGDYNFTSSNFKRHNFNFRRVLECHPLWTPALEQMLAAATTLVICIYICMFHMFKLRINYSCFIWNTTSVRSLWSMSPDLRREPR